MQIIGCDLHAAQQTIAMLDGDTGEVVERTLTHDGDTVREFYASIPGPAVVGLEATGIPEKHLGRQRRDRPDAGMRHQSRRRRPRQDRLRHPRIELIDLRSQVLVQRDELTAAMRGVQRQRLRGERYQAVPAPQRGTPT